MNRFVFPLFSILGLPRAVNVVKSIADQSDLVEDGGVWAEVVGAVAALLTPMEHLALSVDVGVEARLRLGGAVKAGLGDGVVGRVLVGVTAGQDGLHLGEAQRRLQQVKDILARELVLLAALRHRASHQAQKHKKLHGDISL